MIVSIVRKYVICIQVFHVHFKGVRILLEVNRIVQGFCLRYDIPMLWEYGTMRSIQYIHPELYMCTSRSVHVYI